MREFEDKRWTEEQQKADGDKDSAEDAARKAAQDSYRSCVGDLSEFLEADTMMEDWRYEIAGEEARLYGGAPSQAASDLIGFIIGMWVEIGIMAWFCVILFKFYKERCWMLNGGNQCQDSNPCLKDGMQ